MIKKSDEISQRLSQQLRESAEAQLEGTEPTNEPDMAASKLLYELRVHQIELEMQNEELRRAQLALTESRDRYIDLYEFAPVGYLTINQNGIITEANIRAAKLFGVERVKLINCRFTHYITPDDKFRWHHYFLTARQQLANQTIELALCRADGAFLYAQIDCLAIKESDDFPALRITITDITERKLMEDALQEQKIRLDLALDSAELAAWDCNIETGQCVYDKRWTNICGYSPEDMGTHIGFWEQGIIPDDASNVQKALAEHFNDHPPIFNAEYRIRHHSGELLWILDRGKVVQWNSAGKALRMTGVAMDITQRKQMEQQLQISAAAFETQAGIIITDAEKTIISTNKAFTRITGYSAEEILGAKLSLLHSGLHDEDFYQNICASVNREGYWEGEIWDKRKNGELFPVWQTVSFVKDVYGHVTHYVASFIDISAQKQAEKVLLEHQQQLQNQVATTEEELEKIKQDSININAALDVLLKQREKDRYQAKDVLSREMDETVFPFLKKLKKAVQTNKYQAQLLEIIEDNLQQLLVNYGRDTSLSNIYQKLTPAEVQIASMIRMGMSSKTIATTLNLSTGTIGIHRKHIRKKLGLSGSNDSLYCYLLSLAE